MVRHPRVCLTIHYVAGRPLVVASIVRRRVGGLPRTGRGDRLRIGGLALGQTGTCAGPAGWRPGVITGYSAFIRHSAAHAMARVLPVS
jgi:hypothetical protein